MSHVETPLEEAVRVAGSQAELARRCGTSQPRIWQCLNRNRLVPADLVLSIERATQVSRHRLRTDLYPEAPSTLNQMMPHISTADQSAKPSGNPYSTEVA